MKYAVERESQSEHAALVRLISEAECESDQFRESEDTELQSELILDCSAVNKYR